MERADNLETDVPITKACLSEQRAGQTLLTAAEADPNARVYRLFDLTDDEIQLLQQELGQ